MTNQLPMIRLEVDRMRYAVIHALTQHNDEIAQAVDRELQRLLESYDFGKAVQEAAADALQRAVQAYFRSGAGWQIMREAVEAAMGEIFRDQQE